LLEQWQGVDEGCRGEEQAIGSVQNDIDEVPSRESIEILLEIPDVLPILT